MNLISFDTMPVIFLLLSFLVAAAVVWFCGSKLSAIADQVAEKTGIGRAIIGVLLLGGITSLPEIATTISAALQGQPGMAVSNVLGGVSMQVTLLAFADFWLRKKPLSTSTSNISIIIQGLLVVVLLAFTSVFILLPSVAVFHVGIESVLIFLLFIISIHIIHKYSRYLWVSYESSSINQIQEKMSNLSTSLKEIKQQAKTSHKSKQRVSLAVAFKKNGFILFLLSGLILVAGFVVVRTSEVIADLSGISTSFAGFLLIAITTSLPEISSVASSVKLKRFDLVYSNIFGTNLFDIALLFVADLLYAGGPIFDAVNSFAIIAAVLGIILTCIFLLEIGTKSRKTILGIGYGSAVVIIVYLAGVLTLFYFQSINQN